MERRMNRQFYVLLLFMFVGLTQLTAQNSDNAVADTAKYKMEDLQFLSLEELVELMNQPVYSISKQEEKLSEAPMSVYQISKDELNRWGVRYLYETLGRVPGYTFYNTDYYGQYGVMARGWQSIWRYGYSIELMPVVDFGHSSFPNEFFGNMEAVRGPAGLAWGSSANAGLVNANLRSDLNGAEVVAQYGNYNQYSVSALYGQQFKDNNGSMFFGFNQKGQDYEIQENAFDQPNNDWKTNGLRPSYSFVGKVNYKNFKTVVYLEHNDHYSPQLWFADAYQRSSTNQWEETSYAQFWKDIKTVTGEEPHDQLNVLCYRMEYALPIQSDKVNISVYHNYYNRIWYFEPVASLGDHKRDVGFNANFKLLKDRLNLTMGSDLFGQSRINMYSNNHKFALDHGVDWYSNTNSASDITYNNAFMQATYNLTDYFKLIGGARIDYQDDGKFTDVIAFYRGGAIFNLSENHVLKYFYNKAPRRPQANERTQTSPDAENLDAHELALVGSFSKKLDYSITLYHQRLNNQITRDPLTFNDFANTGGLAVSGVEWSVSTVAAKGLLVYWNGSALSPEVKKKEYVDNNGVVQFVAEAHNSDDQPLFVPTFNSFLGAEYNIVNMFKFNVAWRGIYGIPYLDSNNQEKKASTNFMDMTITSKKFWNKLELSFVALNFLDNRKGLPAYGEHAKNQAGTIEPEGMRFYFKTRFTIPD